jgi:hypothetical protein
LVRALYRSWRVACNPANCDIALRYSGLEPMFFNALESLHATVAHASLEAMIKRLTRVSSRDVTCGESLESLERFGDCMEVFD